MKRKSQNILTILILTLLMILVIGCSPSVKFEQRILGQWKLVEKDNAYVYFNKEGNMFVRAQKPLDTSYEITEKDEKTRKMTLKIIDPEDNEEIIWNITFTEDFKQFKLDSKQDKGVFIFVNDKQQPF